jgi:beta-galactosidase GanA
MLRGFQTLVSVRSIPVPRKFLPAFLLLLAASVMQAQTPPVAVHSSLPRPSLPSIAKKDGRYALIVDGTPYLMLGAQINNSSAWPAMLPKVWPAIDDLHANTVEMPIYWEQFESAPGHYDDSVMLTLLAQARQHKIHLVLLWFGTWKNGSGHYTPAWIKQDNPRYPRVICSDGRTMDSLSPLFPATLEADRTAFTAFMRHLKAADPQHTVIMVQVENESGTWGCVRDSSPTAQKLFAGPVPAELIAGLHKQPGTWSEVFGDDADEFFHAWYVAHFVGQVAAAGKAVYPLPMYANAAMRPAFNPRRGTYESGGPTDNVLDIWKIVAPAIDVLSPDIYTPNYDAYTRYLDEYGRANNAMFIPETGNQPPYARYFFTAVGHGAIGFSPFGMDFTGYRNGPLADPRLDKDALAPFALNYAIAGSMDRELAQLNFDGKLKGVSENPAEHRQTLDFGAWQAVVSYGMPQFGMGREPAGNPDPIGGALIGELAPNQFLVTAIHARVDFNPADPGKQRQFIRVEEGHYENGTWHFERIWNGDQTDYGLNFMGAAQVLRVTLATY